MIFLNLPSFDLCKFVSTLIKKSTKIPFQANAILRQSLQSSKLQSLRFFEVHGKIDPEILNAACEVIPFIGIDTEKQENY